jgi:hypothetical protein
VEREGNGKGVRVISRGTQTSHPKGRSLFSPCPNGSYPYCMSSYAFPSQVSAPLVFFSSPLFFNLKKGLFLNGLIDVCLTFVILKLLVKERKKRREK